MASFSSGFQANFDTITPIKLPEIDLNGFIKDVQASVSTIGDALQGIQADVVENFENAVESFNNWRDEVFGGLSDFAKETQAALEENTKVFIQNVQDSVAAIADGLASFAATGAMIIGGVLNGVGNFLEEIVDFGVILGSALITLPFAIADGVAYLATGEELGAVDALWAATEAFVATEWVNTGFQWFYTETEIGKGINAKSNEFFQYGNTGYSAAQTVGYVGGMIAFSVATGGIGSAGAAGGAMAGLSAAGKAAKVAKIGGKVAGKKGASLAFSAGTGRGAAEAWNDGAGTFEGLAYGVASGAWEAGQWAAGNKFAGQSLKTVGFDMLSGAVDTPFRCAIQGIYSDDSFLNRFENSGGFTAMAVNSLVATGFSGFGELPSAKKFFGNDNKGNIAQNFKESGAKVIDNAKSLLLPDDIFQLNLKAPSIFDKLFGKVQTSSIDNTFTDIAFELENFNQLIHDDKIMATMDNYAYGVQNGYAMVYTDVEFKQRELYDSFVRLIESPVFKTTNASIEPYDFFRLYKASNILKQYGKDNNFGDNYWQTAIDKYLITGNLSYITRNGGARSIIGEYSKEQLSDFLSLSGKIIKSQDASTYDFFKKSMDSQYYHFGADQGALKKLSNTEFVRLKQKLNDMGYSNVEAKQVMEMVDSVGACTYAATINLIYDHFKNKPLLFEQYFGFPMFKKDMTFNDAELLLDMYTYINDVQNGGKLFDINGSTKIVDIDAHSQVYLSYFNGVNLSAINNYLHSKIPTLEYTAITQFGRSDSDMSAFYDRQTGKRLNFDVASLKKEIEKAFADKCGVQLVIYTPSTKLPNGSHIFEHIEFESLNPSVYRSRSTKNWNEGAGHALAVVDVWPDGLIVSSWGMPYKISFSNLEFSNFSTHIIKIQENLSSPKVANTSTANANFSQGVQVQASKGSDSVKTDIYKKLGLTDLTDDFDRSIVEILQNPLKRGTVVDNNVKKILENLDILSKYNSNLRFAVANSAMFWGPMNAICLSLRDSKTPMTVLHELGHTVWHTVLGDSDSNKLIKTWEITPTEEMKDVITLAQENAMKNFDKLSALVDEAQQTVDTCIKQADDWFEQISDSETARISKLVDEIFESQKGLDVLEAENINIKEIKQEFEKAGLSADDINDLLGSKELVKDIVIKQNAMVQKHQYYDNLMSDYAAGGDVRKFTSITNSIMQKIKITSENGDNSFNCIYGHSDEYWSRLIDEEGELSPFRTSFDELMADYFSLAASGRIELIDKLRGIFGNEIFDALSSEYGKIIDKATNDGFLGGL